MPERIAADFLPDTLPDNPMYLVDAWLRDARGADFVPNPNAMTLATSEDGRPTARIVLCKGFDAEAGIVDFYTNYESAKSRVIDAQPEVALVFHWDHQSRQVRIEGLALRAPAEQSDAYFASRPRKSQLGAWASAQSQPIASRDAMLQRFEAATAEHAEDTVARPPHWGGYRVWARACELWVEGAGRVHDRARFERELTLAGDSVTPGAWRGSRLQP
ncbi:MAG: pyridoxamine 5'-phosphate oxidase [Pseudomonadota bacterium]